MARASCPCRRATGPAEWQNDKVDRIVPIRFVDNRRICRSAEHRSAWVALVGFVPGNGSALHFVNQPDRHGTIPRPEVFRAGAENGTRDGCAPRSISEFGFIPMRKRLAG